jgi:hypothetical protein
MHKSALIIFMILACSAAASALPDLTVTDIEFWSSTPCPGGTGMCGMYVAPTGNLTYLQVNYTFTPSAVMKNIGDSPTDTRWSVAFYVDNQFASSIWTGSCWSNSSCESRGYYNYSVDEHGMITVHLQPNQTMQAGGVAKALTSGLHNVTAMVNKGTAPGFTGGYDFAQIVNESNFDNNIFTEFIWVGAAQANNPPTMAAMPNLEINETDYVRFPIPAYDVNTNDFLRWVVLRDGVVVYNDTDSSFQWQTARGDNGTYVFTLVAYDTFNASANTTFSMTVHHLPFANSSEECDDGNNETWEAADGTYIGRNHYFTAAGTHEVGLSGTVKNKICAYNKTFTLYGHVVDSHTGNDLAGKKISIIDKNTYDPNNGAGNYEGMQPKVMPDAFTNSRGFWYANLANGIYHFIVNGSKEEEYEAYVNTSKGKEKRDAELNENITSTNFNAEGHIIYSGEYNGNNKYLCGERVKFTMFGVNNGGTDETITFNVQDHTSNGNPNAPVIYTGNISNPSETLTVNAGNKTHKIFYWRIPCGLNYGRYDIHVIWDDEQWHKIGNFFIEEDVTNPAISVTPEHISVHANENFTIYYWAGDVPQNGTIYQYKILMLGYNDTSVNVSTDVNNDGSIEQTTYGGDYIPFTGSFNATSGEKQIKLTATDLSGNNASTFVNATVFITEQEAMNIGVPWYNYFPFNDQGCEDFDLNIDVNLGSSYVSLNADRYAGVDWCEEGVGDEYMTPGNGVDESGEYSDYDKLQEVMYGSFYSSPCMGPEWFQPIKGTTSVGYNYTFLSYMYYLGNVCGIGLAEGPWFNGTGNINFAPQIYAYEPEPESLTIPYTSAISFSALARDPNAGNFTMKFYVDGNLTWTRNFPSGYYNGGIDSYTFIGSPSNIGMHEIRVEVADLNNSIDLDPYNWQTSHVWHLYVSN